MSKTTTNQTSRLPAELDELVTPARAKLSYAVMLVGFVVLAASGVGSFIVGNVPMTGWILMLHVGSAPLFAIGLALVALTWPGRPEQTCFTRAMLWLVLLSGFVVILSGVIPMTPLFGTDEQHTLYLVHRYSAFVLTGAVVLHLVSAARSRRCGNC